MKPWFVWVNLIAIRYRRGSGDSSRRPTSYSVGLALFAEARGSVKVAEVRDRKRFGVLGEEASASCPLYLKRATDVVTRRSRRSLRCSSPSPLGSRPRGRWPRLGTPARRHRSLC